MQNLLPEGFPFHQFNLHLNVIDVLIHAISCERASFYAVFIFVQAIL